MKKILVFIMLIMSSLLGFSQNQPTNSESGKASFYSKTWDGRRTSSGEKLNSTLYTAAHKTLPFGTLVRVTNLTNCNWVIVKINDRGPHIKNRIIDLSWGAAKHLGIIAAGIAEVEVEVVQ
jgi:rare lipoprotein A